MLSALMTTPSKAAAISRASADLPLAVGPPRMTAAGIVGSAAIDPQRHPLIVAIPVDKQGHDAIAAILRILDSLVDVAGGADGLLVDLDNDVAGMKTLLGRRALVLDVGHDHALGILVARELVAERGRDLGQSQAEGGDLSFLRRRRAWRRWGGLNRCLFRLLGQLAQND